MNRSSPFNPPVQGSVPATPDTRYDQGRSCPLDTRPTLRGLDAAKGLVAAPELLPTTSNKITISSKNRCIVKSLPFL